MCDLETSRIGAPYIYIYIYDLSNLRVKARLDFAAGVWDFSLHRHVHILSSLFRCVQRADHGHSYQEQEVNTPGACRIPAVQIFAVSSKPKY